MVKRPPLRLQVAPMTLGDLPAVHRIEHASFSSPWPDDAYRSELQTNRLASYLVVRAAAEIVAFGGIWLMVDEAHITTFAVDPAWRRQGIGERLLLALLDVALARRAREATLEVRLSNVAARRLYEKYGFRPVGLRPSYYTDDGEDALIMTTEVLDAPAMRTRLAGLRAALDGSGDGSPHGLDGASPMAPDAANPGDATS
ncbi:MAG TPA: ribosomal protein S18-alanine N-acetyltransferase [Candidatus Eisenbacteria bacterium]|nr:ribosomal protein S18-alanine N-acetyltransferase [Candidatus Eisenbacteria bacterium]